MSLFCLIAGFPVLIFCLLTSVIFSILRTIDFGAKDDS